MKQTKTRSYSDKLKLRNRVLWGVFAAMLVYMVIVGETGGDSRVMTDLATTVSRVIFFGGMICVLTQIFRNKKLLKDRLLRKEQLREEMDERNQYLHDKSGGTVMDILLILLLFVTLTTSLYHMAAFYTALSVLLAAVLLKLGALWFFRRG